MFHSEIAQNLNFHWSTTIENGGKSYYVINVFEIVFVHVKNINIHTVHTDIYIYIRYMREYMIYIYENEDVHNVTKYYDFK